MENVSKDHTVEFNGTSILTTVTNDSCKVEVIVHELRASLAATTVRVVGCDIKYKTSNNNSIAIMQLCHGTRCLIIQFPRLDSIPNSLIRFFCDRTIRFVGVDISEGFAKLTCEYDSIYGYYTIGCFDLALTVDRIRDGTHANSVCDLEFSELTAEILRVVYVKPAVVAQYDWGVGVLTNEQVRYATLDAYVSFAIMNKLSKEEMYKHNYFPALGINI